MRIVCLGRGMCDGSRENRFEQLIVSSVKSQKKKSSKIIDSRWVYKQASEFIFFRLLLPYFDRTEKSWTSVVCCHWLWLLQKCVMFSKPGHKESLYQLLPFSLERNIETKTTRCDLKISKLCLHTTQKLFSLFASVINYKQFSNDSLLFLCCVYCWRIDQSFNHCDHNIFVCQQAENQSNCAR